MYSAHMLEFICSKLSSNSSSEQADSVAGGLAIPSGWPKETPRWPTKSGWRLDSEPSWFWAILIYRVRPTLKQVVEIVPPNSSGVGKALLTATA